MTFRDLPFDKSGGLMHFLRPALCGIMDNGSVAQR
jgi:hypothetical protein